MGQDTATQPIFSRHETFHPRFGWIKKGFEKSSQDNAIFSKDSAPVVLGVGKNMVKAIKYWSIAFKVVDECRVNGKYAHTPTKFAHRLLGERGWDPFLENPASLWLLHWNLLKPPCYAPAWYFAFNEFNKTDFSVDDLLFSLREFRDLQFSERKIQDSSLKKDINCLLRMYVEKAGQKGLKEDSIDCPFSDLAMINAYIDSKRFAFNFGQKPSLPPEVIVSACLEFSASFQDDAKTITISRLLYDEGSPGRVFKLNENVLNDAIEIVSKKTNKVFLIDSAGMVQLSFNGEPLSLSEKILDGLFKKGN